MIRNTARSAEEPVVHSCGCGDFDGRCGRGSERGNAWYSMCGQFSGASFRIQHSGMSSLFLSSLFNNHVQHFWFTWRASEPRKARYSMYGQLGAVYGRARGAGERVTDKTLRTVCMGRCHAFSNSPHWQALTIS